MRRAIALALGLLTGLGLTACLDYDDELFAYCAKQGTCECEGGLCCASRGQPCSPSVPCCGATVCSTQNRCDDPVILVFTPLSQKASYIQEQSRDTPRTLTLNNSGGGTSRPIQVWPSRQARHLQLDASGCTGRVLGKGESCSVTITYPADAPFEADSLAVTAQEEGSTEVVGSDTISLCIPEENPGCTQN